MSILVLNRSSIIIRILMVLLIGAPQFGYAQSMSVLAQPKGIITSSPPVSPIILKGLKVFPENPFRMDFYVDPGTHAYEQDQLEHEIQLLVKYFLAGLTVPESDLWVNLSPYEEDRIIPETFGLTEMGQELLIQDYMLKQLTASFTSVESHSGKQFWDVLLKRISQKADVDSMQMNILNKVWIVPDKAGIYQSGNSVYVVDAHLKVMLEKDYLASKKEESSANNQQIAEDEVTLDVMREIVIPEIEKEINEGEHFAKLRQIYHSVILALWFKENLQRSLLGEVYVDKQRIKGVDGEDPDVKDKVYHKYIDIFREGVSNQIREEYDPVMQKVVAQKIFSGGTELGRSVKKAMYTAGESQYQTEFAGQEFLLSSVHLSVDYSALRHDEGADSDRVKYKRSLDQAAAILSQQDANVVFEKNKRTNKWVFRRGPIDLKVNDALTQALGERLESQERSAILIALRGGSQDELQLIMENILYNDGDFIEAFSEKGIDASDRFKRVLLVAPYGDMEGRPLRYKVPSKGVEMIAHRIIRETNDVDALVYNPNLSSPDELYKYVEDNRFDMIGISIMQTVLKENLRILGKLSTISPETLFVAGGMELSKFPFEQVFASWPVDALALDTLGNSFIELSRQMQVGQSKSERIALLPQINDVVFTTVAGELVKTKTDENPQFPVIRDLNSEIPFNEPDLTHGEVYDRDQDADSQPIAFDRIGRQPTRIAYGNFCKGKCIFCGTPLNTRPDLSNTEVVEYIRLGTGNNDDSVHFESADFFFDQQHAAQVSDTIAQTPDIRMIPKLAIARVDEVGDGELLNKLADAGFQIVAYGIESFDDTVLKKIGKQTSEAQNKKALDLTVAAGIKPGMNLIFFSPHDTVDSMLKTVTNALDYMDKGAYINLVPYMFGGYGRPISNAPRLLDFEDYDFPGLKQPFQFPKYTKSFDEDLARIKGKFIDKFEMIKPAGNYPSWSQRSVTIDSLLYFKTYVTLLTEENLKEKPAMDAIIARIDEAINRTLRAEESTLKQSDDVSAKGVIETWFNPFNQLLSKVVLQTEDGRKVLLRITDDYPGVAPGRRLPDQIIYDMVILNDDQEEYRGWVEMKIDENDRINSHRVTFRRLEQMDVFIHRVIRDMINQLRANADLFLDHQADYRVIGPELVPHFHRLPSEPLFGETVSAAVRQGIHPDDLARQIKVTYEQGYAGLADAIRNTADAAALTNLYRSNYYTGDVESDDIARNPVKYLRPDLAASDMDLTQFPDDQIAAVAIVQLAEDAIAHGVAAVSIYPHHMQHLPVEKLKAAGIHIGVVSAFPKGLAAADISAELATLDQAVAAGADEVDFVIDVKAILDDQQYRLHQEMAQFALGVESIKQKYQTNIRVKAILETQALKSDAKIRLASRIALQYADMIKMVSGFPVDLDNGEKGRADLRAARIMLEEILHYYRNTGILRGMKVTGGVNTWESREDPNRSAKLYYELALKILGNHLGSHYIFERDLFRVGGYASLPAFVDSSDVNAMRPATRLIGLDQYNDQDLVIPTETETSLNLDAYLSTKFPPELVNAMSRSDTKIEIHRGSSTASWHYMRSLVFEGTTAVTELERTEGMPPSQRVYRVEKEGAVTYHITGVIGSTRELFLLQAITQHFNVSRENISLRVFEDEFEKYFLQGLGRYAGSIHKAVVLHEIDNYADVISSSVNFTVVDRINTDYVDAIVIETEEKQRILLFEIQYAYGAQAYEVIKRMVSPVDQNGLGISDITLHGAAGAVGDEMQLNDLVLFDTVVFNGEDVTSGVDNDIDRDRLESLLPENVGVHVNSVHSIPTVLNGSISFMDQVNRQGGGAIELELAHAVDAIKEFEGVRFRAFHEVHDKPATSAGLERREAIGGDVRGATHLEVRHALWQALANYIVAPSDQVLSMPTRANEVQSRPRFSQDIRSEERTRKNLNTIQSVLFKKAKDNIIFLGQGEGISYYNELLKMWKGSKDFNTRDFVYWDARDYQVSLQQGKSIFDLIPSIDQDGVVFIDNIDVILEDPALRREFLRFIGVSPLSVVGYMPAGLFQDVENSFQGNDGFNHEEFGELNFDIANEFNPLIKDKKIVVLGATGFVGLPVLKELKKRGYTNVVGVSQSGDIENGVVAIDLTDQQQLAQVIDGADFVINAAVSLDFPGMEQGGESRENARAVNVGIPQAIADLGFEKKIIHLSTYYVFGDNEVKVSGQSSTAPRSVYGQQKLESEKVLSALPNASIVRLGPMFGLDTRGRQKRFYESVVQQLENKRLGRPAETIKTPNYPYSSIVYVKDVASGIVSLLENNGSGIQQLSGDEGMNAEQQVRLFEEVYNEKFGANVSLDLEVIDKRRQPSLTPNVQMYSVIHPDLKQGIQDFIDEIISAHSVTGEAFVDRDSAALGDFNVENKPEVTGGIDLSPTLELLNPADFNMLLNIPSDKYISDPSTLRGIYPSILQITPVIVPSLGVLDEKKDKEINMI